MRRTKSLESRKGPWRAVLLLALAPLLADCASTSADTSYAEPAAGNYFTVTVHRGDTVSDIAYRYRVDEEDIVAMNGLRDRHLVFEGERLKVPAYGRLRDVRTASAARADAREPAPRPQPKPDSVYAPQVTSGFGSIFDFSQESSAQFLWPVRGPIISPYGARTNGERNDGINISAPHGTPIRAAAAGIVTYAGNELRGYGNLVLIRHDNGYVTAYAHAESIAVRRGERVAQGQIIAYSGETGDVREPQVHFEIRRGVTPVDPKPLLIAYR